ncbi:conserved hypothetical protein [Verrucomicrobia bacterium]|nr:conserved hypothetical protein [Verrucomicrobiota bacterium]
MMKTTEMADKVQDWQERATEKARNMGQATDQYVRDNMWATIGIVAVVGCVLGFLLASRGD